MPTDTFFKLPEEKRERIIKAAVDEFARVPFSEASINRIVKAAGIPRGSFYQYFSDKEDLFLLVLGRISQEKIDVFAQGAVSHHLGLIDLYSERALNAVFDWAEKNHEYSRIGYLMTQDGSDFIRQAFEKINIQSNTIKTWLENDRKRGLIRPDADLDIFAEVFFSASVSLINTYFSGTDRQTVMNKIKALFDILGKGILSEEARNGRSA